ncbi:MAG TPA: hypothetical protein VIG74_00455 [Alphaproteobacteria bacterium]
MENETENTTESVPVNDGYVDINLLKTTDSLRACLAHLRDTVPIDEIVKEIEYVMLLDHGGNELESLLATQARVLDAAFHRSVSNTGGSGAVSFDRGIRLALTAQRQFRETLQTLRLLQSGFLGQKTACLRRALDEAKDADAAKIYDRTEGGLK